MKPPYDKNNNPSIPADFDGLTNSTTIQGNLSIIRIAKQEINNEFRTEMNKNCAKYLGQSTFVGGCGTGDLTKWIKSLPEPQRQALCERYKARDCSALAEVWKQMFVTERELLRADLEDRDVIEPVQAFISGVKAKIGKESFSFIEEIASDTSKANETPWSISAYGNIMRGRWIFGGGVEFQESFKEQSESSVCIPQTDPSGTLVCKNVRLGAPNKVKRKLAFADVH